MNQHLQEYFADSSERYYVLAGPELSIYGHTVDQFTRRNFPEDVARTRELMLRGREFGCWHSQWCPEGELGSNDVGRLRLITKAQFEQAMEGGWPYEHNLTDHAPAVQIKAFDNDKGEWVDVYDSSVTKEGRPRGSNEA